MDIRHHLASDYLRGTRDVEAVLRQEPLLFSLLCEERGFLGNDGAWRKIEESLASLPSDEDSIAFGRAVLTVAGKAGGETEDEDWRSSHSYRHRSRSSSNGPPALLSVVAGLPEALLQLRVASVRALTSAELRRQLASDGFCYASCYWPVATGAKKMAAIKSGLFRTLRNRMVEFAGRRSRGEILPAFALIENPSTGMVDVDFEPVRADDASLARSLRSLEEVLCRSFLDYDGATPVENFMSAALPDDIAKLDKCPSALDFLGRQFTLLSLERFEYALWIVSGCSDAEIAATLSSIAQQFDANKSENRERPSVDSFGHVRCVKASPTLCADKDEHYEASVASAWECLVGPQWPEGQERPSFMHTSASKKDRDAVCTAFEDAVRCGDLLSGVSFLSRWMEPGYAAGKAVAMSLMEELRAMVEADKWFVFERDSALRGGGISRAGSTTEPAESLASLFRAACRCMGAKCKHPTNILLGMAPDDARDRCRLLCRMYSALSGVAEMQMHTDFRAGVRQADGYAGSEIEAFCEGRTALADLGKLLLHRRYGELALQMESMGSPDYAVLCEHVGGLIPALVQCGERESGYPEPVVEITGHKPSLTLLDEEDVSFPQFQQLLGIQLYGVLVKRLLANDIGLATRPALVTNSAIDQLLTRLWNRECRSVKEIVAALDEFRVNLLQYLANYRLRQPEAQSGLSMDEVKVLTSPIRDRALIAKLNPMILVVDDEAMMIEILRSTFERIGFRVYEAHDGEEGLDLYKKHAGGISAVVTDQMMGRMNGDEMAGRIRELSDVPIVMCSGASMSRLRESAPIDAFIDKGAGMGELVDTVLEILAKHDPATYGQAGLQK